MAATKRDFAINYGLKTDFTGTSAGSTLFVDQSGDKVGIGLSSSLSGKLHVYGAPVDVGDAQGQVYIEDSAAYNANPKSGINFFAKYNSGNSKATLGSIFVSKDNTTDGDYAGSMSFVSRENGAQPKTRLVITGTGEIKANGSFQESTDDGTTYWNVVTQQDVGTAANQVPLNQYLGQLAFLDDFSPNGLRRSGGSSDDVSIDSNGIVTFNGTGSLVIPSGSTSQQTPTTTGAIRFNTTISSFEGYNGASWGKIGGGATVSTSAPTAGIANGDLWYDSEGGRLYIYYSDADSNQWVDASPFGIPTSLEITNGLLVSGGNGTFSNTVDIGNGQASSGAGRLNVKPHNSQDSYIKIRPASDFDSSLNSGSAFDVRNGANGVSHHLIARAKEYRLWCGDSTGEKIRIHATGRVSISGTAQSGLLTVGDVDSPAYNRGAVAIKALADQNDPSLPVNLYLEEASGAEGWQLSVDSDGDLNFHNSGVSAPVVHLLDSNIVGINTDTVNDTAVGLVVKNGASGSEHTIIDIISDSLETGRIVFSDGTYNMGSVRYNHGTNADYMTFHTNGNTERLRIDSSGHTLPGLDNTYDLGSSTSRWRNIYTGDLQLSNEGDANDVDGTWGQYTIQEGEEDLFLLNRRSGKKYKFVLQEV